MSTAETTSLEQIIDDQAATAQPEATPPATPKAETGETTAAPPAAGRETAEEPPTVPRRALEDERRKRQEYEQRLDQLQRYIQAQQQPPPQQPKQEPPAPDYYADPEGWQRHQQAQMQAAIQRERETFQRELVRVRVEQSEQLLRTQKQDFDEYKDLFVAAVQHAPQLLGEMVRAPNPAQYAYEIGRYLKVMSEVGSDPDGYVERKLAERQAVAAPPAAQSARTAPVPKSLASTTSTAPRDPRNGQFTTRAPLEDLIG